MIIAKFIPSRIKRDYHLINGYIHDLSKGYLSRIASPGDQVLKTPYEIRLTQSIRHSHLYENKLINLRIASNRMEEVVIKPGIIFSF